MVGLKPTFNEFQFRISHCFFLKFDHYFLIINVLTKVFFYNTFVLSIFYNY